MLHQQAGATDGRSRTGTIGGFGLWATVPPPAGSPSGLPDCPQALWPRTTPCRASLGSRPRWHTETDGLPGGRSVTSTGATGSSMTSHRCTHPPCQVSPAPVGTDRHGMLHPPGRSHALAGEAMAARLSGLLFLRRLPAGVRLITRHPRRPSHKLGGMPMPNPV